MCEDLMEEVVKPENCERALRAGNSNRGAPGIDGMTTLELEGYLAQHWEKIRGKMPAGIPKGLGTVAKR